MGRPTNVLIVDDEVHVRVFLRLIMRELGIERCWEAGDGVTVMKMVEEHKPELVLLDIAMPVKGGLEVLAELTDSFPDVPVVVVSAQSATGTVQQSAELGAVGYIIKNSPKEQLQTALGEVLDSLEGFGEDRDGAS